MHWQTTPEHGCLLCSVVATPTVTPVKKMDFPSASSLLGRVGDCVYFSFFMLGFCAGPVHGVTVSEFICVSTPMYLGNAVDTISLGFRSPTCTQIPEDETSHLL